MNFRLAAPIGTFAFILALQVVLLALLWPFRPMADEPGVSEPTLTIEPSLINLGELGLNEVRELQASIENHSSQLVHLEEPRTSCGCVSAKLTDSAIGPHQKTELRFSVIGPSEPRDFHQQILLTALDLPNVRLQLKIEGVASAKVWAIPERVGIELSENSSTSAEISVMYVSGEEPGAIVCDSTAVEIKKLPSAAGELRLAVSCNSQIAGNSPIKVYAGEASKAAKPILEIPLQWYPRPWIKVVPGRLVIKNSERSSAVIEKKLFVYVDPRRLGDNPVVTPMAAWLKVPACRKLNNNVYELTVNCDVSSTPSEIDRTERLLKISLPGMDQSAIHVLGATVR